MATFSRKPIFGYKFVAFASIGIAVLGFLVWGHHMFVAGQSIYAGVVFSVLSMLVAVPSAIKVFNWTATLYKGSISWDTPMIYALGFIGLFTIGGLTGVMLATLGIDAHVHDTYFIIAHFHYIMVGGAIMGYLGGLHFWWPKITGRLYPVFWSKLSALVVFIGFNVTFFPQFILGYLGMPRRYHAYPPEFQVLNVMSSAGATILGIGYLMPLVYFIWSMRYGPKAPPNPWGATGLEWKTTSPPPVENFKKQPVVTAPPYTYPGRMPAPEVALAPDAHATSLGADAAAHGHAAGLAHHFDSYEQQKESAALGMWTFLVTEILFFGGLFAAYGLYRSLYPEVFRASSHTLVDPARHVQHRRPHRELAHDGARRARRPDRQGEALGASSSSSR